MILAWLLSMLAIAPVHQGMPALSPQTATETPEMADARANRTRMKTPPRFVSSDIADAYPEAARAQGAHGEVSVSVIVTRDGKIIQATIETSSRSKILDDFALARASAGRFEPAKDDAGNAIAVPITLITKFNTGLDGRDGGIAHYRCDQFVRDQDWWRAQWPAGQDDTVYTVVRGVTVVLGTSAVSRSIPSKADFKRHWDETIEACRKQPESMLIDVLKPEGEYLRSLAAQGMM